MKNNSASEKFHCEFCERDFVRENTLLKHICENKRRWQDKDKRGNQIGFQAWIQFYTKHSSRKKKEYTDFIKNSYYSAFIKFGNYCLEAQVMNVPRYIDWLLKEKISIDQWNRDSNYTKFIIDYCKNEDPLDAIARSIETTVALAEQDRIQTKDVLRYGNRNKICFEITKGKISPWMLYHSESGIEFISKLDTTQEKMILDYINPEQWAIKFKKHKNIIPEVKELLRAGGY
jgi:hypothetical protein